MRWFKKRERPDQETTEAHISGDAMRASPDLLDQHESFIVGVRSPEGERVGASRTPLFIYGHMALRTAQQIAQSTTVTCVAIAGLEQLSTAISRIPSIGLCAMSRPEYVGEAEAAIRCYRSESPTHGMALYGAWDYHVERAALRAIACQADGITMPGILTHELYAYILGVMREVFDGAPPPTQVEEHRERLRRYTTMDSPFWSQQDLIHSRYY